MNFTSYPLRHWLCLLLCWTSLSMNAQTLFQAHLTGHQEALPVATLAYGEITANVEAGKLTVSGSFENLSAELDTSLLGGVHLHFAYAGQNGPVFTPLIVTYDEDLRGGTIEAANNIFDIAEDETMAFVERQCYVNVHSLNYPGGEIRGQLLPAEADQYSANLFGSYEVPLVMSTGSGAVAIDLVGTEMTLTGSFQGLEGDFVADGGGAHIHLGLVGVNGAVVHPLSVDLNSDMRSGVFAAADNVFTLTEGEIGALEARQLYINIHSSKNPNGELRGQIVGGTTRTVFRSHLSGSNEVPPVTSTATGMLLTEVLDDETILVTGSFQNLESDLATEIVGGGHLHIGVAGRNGSVLTPLSVASIDTRTGIFPASANEYTFSVNEMTALYNRGVFANIHSETHQNGELRGQLLPESQMNFNGFLSSTFEIPSLASNGFGGLKVELQGTQMTVSGSFTNLSSALATDIDGGIHLHLGHVGTTGAVVFPLNPTLNSDLQGGVFDAMDNTFELTAEQIDLLRQRQYYVNIHTENYNTGELRAQILHEATTYFVAPLSGASEVPAVHTPAFGMIAIEYNGGRGFLTGAFSDLQSDFNIDAGGGAHIHNEFAGRNGEVVHLLTPSINADNQSGVFHIADNSFSMSDGFLDTMRLRWHYANLHSVDVPSGELRGPFLPLSTAYFMANLNGLNEVEPIVVDGHGAAVLELSGNQLIVSGSYSDLSSDLDGNAMGGTHIHNAAVGENGGIELLLGSAIQPDFVSGIFPPPNNVNELTEEQVDDLLNNNFYINVHSLDFSTGELRAQVLPEINFFPTSDADIITPADGATLTVEGPPATPFVVNWNAAIDRDRLAYIWQLSTDEDFSNLLVHTNVGNQTSFSTDFLTIDMLLENAGLAVGDMVTLYHRAIASDGSLNSPAAAASVTLTRGELMDDPNSADLEVSITAPANYDIYVPVPYTITITNNGPADATNVAVSAGLPEGMVHTSNSVSAGMYSLFFETWTLSNLAVGESATLDLTLFPLIEGVAITNFVQVIASDQADPDSTPDNDTDQTPDEDDEAAATILPNFIPPMGGVDADLELTIVADQMEYNIYEDVTYTITLTNDGPDVAANIIVGAGLPTGMVSTGTGATAGDYDLFRGEWYVPELMNGESAVLTLTFFPLVEGVPITNFVQVLASDQADPDSTPNNDTDGNPDEDDEASITLSPAGNFITPQPDVDIAQRPTNYTLYPVPTQDVLNLAFKSSNEKEQLLRIYSLQGQIVSEQMIGISKGFNQLEIGVENLVTGQYYLVLGERESVLKFSKL